MTMQWRICEFLTTDPSVPDSYGDAGCALTALGQFPIVLRHEHYKDTLRHTIYLFARDPELGAQVFIEIFPMPAGRSEYAERREFYLAQRKEFHMSYGKRFDMTFLAPNCREDFKSRGIFRTRDGKYRRRIVHWFEGVNRAIILVYSLDSTDFNKSIFFKHVSQHLMLSDKPLPFQEDDLGTK